MSSNLWEVLHHILPTLQSFKQGAVFLFLIYASRHKGVGGIGGKSVLTV
jgi:hypothetical protein